MFRLFKKKSEKQKLNKKYLSLLREAKELSTVNRTLSDQKYAEAQEVLDEMSALPEE